MRELSKSDASCGFLCVQLIITVQDRNDNKPEFETSQYLKTVREDLQVDSSVTEGGYSTACMDSNHFTHSKHGGQGRGMVSTNGPLLKRRETRSKNLNPHPSEFYMPIQCLSTVPNQSCFYQWEKKNLKKFFF